MDKNADGKLSRDELIEGYRKIYGEMAEEEVDKILVRVDANGSGEIDYSGKYTIFSGKNEQTFYKQPSFFIRLNHDALLIMLTFYRMDCGNHQ